MLEQTEPKYYGEQEIFFAGEGVNYSEGHWRDRCTDLIISAGCNYFKWSMTETQLTRVIVGTTVYFG